MKRRLFSLVLILVLLFVSCSTTKSTTESKMDVIHPTYALWVGEESGIRPVKDGKAMDLDSLTWKSENEEIVTTGDYGLITGVSKGETVVTIEDEDGCSISVPVKVYETSSEVPEKDNLNRYLNEKFIEKLEESGTDTTYYNSKINTAITESMNNKTNVFYDFFTQVYFGTAEYEKGSAEDAVAALISFSLLDRDSLSTLLEEELRSVSLTIDSIDTMDSLLTYDAEMRRKGVNGLIPIGETLLPVEVLKDDDVFEYDTTFGYKISSLETYDLDTIYTSLLILGESESEAKENADKVFAFFSRMEEASIKEREMMEIEEVSSLLSFDISKSLSILSIESKELAIDDKAQMMELSTLLNEENLQLLKEVEKVYLVATYGKYTSLMSEKEAYSTYRSMGEPDWMTEDLIVAYLSPSLSNDIPSILVYETDYLAVKALYTEEDREILTKLFSLFKEAYKECFNASSWLSEETKKAACEKVDAMEMLEIAPRDFTPFVQRYPLSYYEEGGSLLENFFLIAQSDWELGLEREGKNINEVDMWSYEEYFDCTPFNNPTCNYVPRINKFVLCGAMITEGLTIFRDSPALSSENIGGMGYIIAHEMGHGFDSDGSLFDKNGEKNNWWNDSDREIWEEKLDKVRYLYSTLFLTSIDGKAIYQDGDYTLRENMADIISSEILEEAAKIAGVSYKGVVETTGDIFGYVRYFTPEYLMSDIHSRGDYRINTPFLLMEETYSAFDLDEGDGVYIKPEYRFYIWK